MTQNFNRDTVGKISSDLFLKKPESRDPIELQRAMHKDYEKNIFECIERSKKDFPDNFYVVVITKKERLMDNVLRNYFFGRLSCPTPEYDQAVYYYKRDEEKIEFLWVVPSKNTCEFLRYNALYVVNREKELRNFVLDFYDGELDKIAKMRNNERKDSIIIEK